MNNPDHPPSDSGPGGFLHAFSCRHTLHLISRSLDEKLPARQRVLLHLHLALCTLCRRYRRQLWTIREALPSAQFPANLPGEETLSPAAKDRLRAALRRAQNL